MKRRWLTLVLLALALLIILRSQTSIEEQAFIVSMGIDREPGNMLHITLQLPTVESGGSAGGEGNDTKNKYETVEARAATVIDALDLLLATVPHELNFSQIIQVVVSEQLARETGFGSTLESLLMIKNFRQSCTLVICKDSAKDFLKGQKPYLAIRLSESIRTSLALSYEFGTITDSNVGEVVRLFQGGWQDVLTPYATIKKELPEKELLPGEALAEPPGEMTYLTGEGIEYIGAALFRGDQMVGTLSGKEMQFMSFLLNEKPRFRIHVNGEYFRVEQIGHAALSVDMRNPQWILGVKMTVLANTLQQTQEDTDALRDAITNEVFLLMAKLQDLGVDPAGFQGKAARHVLTLTKWSEVDWINCYQEAALKVSTSIVLGEGE